MKKLRGVVLFACVFQALSLAHAADDLASASTSYAAQQEALISRYLSNTDGLAAIGAIGTIGENFATINQASDSNQAVINQYGKANVATIEQSGGIHNIAMVTQTGNDNFASISQRGNNNLALINQR